MKTLDITGIRKWGIISIITIVMMLSIFHFAAGESLYFEQVTTDMVNNTGVVGEITDGVEIQQYIQPDTDYIKGISLFLGTYARENKGLMKITLSDKANNTLSVKSIDVSKLKDNSMYYVDFEDSIKVVSNQKYILTITSENSKVGNAVTIYYNETESTNGNVLYINGVKSSGELCFELIGENENWFGQLYWTFAIILVLIVISYYVYTLVLFKKGRNTKVITLAETSIKYRFLIKQLITRDFKTKYKRSVLGFLWSFLNPLLTMLVQYVVFSTLFKSDIDNYPIYLLSAGIIFNFFTESVGQGLGSIVSNSSLITKVYIPKAIYPVSKVLSTSINMFISLVPLFFAVLITGERITIAYLVLPFLFVCVILFCIGMSYILSSAMVFFRDTQFLWGIISLLWMYATPIFYPETIIPDNFVFILKLNPMYHFIHFFRIVLMEQIAPQPNEFFYCFISAILVFIIGNWIFKKTQKKFVLYI